MNIAVYLGSSFGTNPDFQKRIAELGTWIGASGHRLIYGGSKTGLMGVLAQSALDAGGEVYGVETRFFMEQEYQMENLTRLMVTETMAERRTKMIELADAFIAFPGGMGTLDEITEVMQGLGLGLMDATCILYNLDGFYEGLKTLLDHMNECGLSSPEKQEKIHFAGSITEIAAILEADAL